MTTTTTDAPRAWVGCLWCYNSGRLHGAWLTVTDDGYGLNLLDAGLSVRWDNPTMGYVDRCNRCGSDEWWVMDHEGIPWLTGECSPATFVAWAETWAEVDDPEMVTAYIDGTNTPSTPDELQEAIDNAHDAYTGHSTVREYAEEYADECLLYNVSDDVARYFDYDAFAHDLEYNGDMFEYGGYVFRST